MWVFIFAEMSVFVLAFILYLQARSNEVDLFRTSQATLSQGYGTLNTVVLLSASACVYLGLKAIRAGDAQVAPWLMGAAVVLAVAFCAIKAFEWSDKASHQIDPSTNDFYSYYFVLTGLHLFHVVCGIGVLVALTVQARRTDFSPTRTMVVEGGTVWWHMVDLNWMILFPLLYLAR